MSKVEDEDGGWLLIDGDDDDAECRYKKLMEMMFWCFSSVFLALPVVEPKDQKKSSVAKEKTRGTDRLSFIISF